MATPNRDQGDQFRRFLFRLALKWGITPQHLIAHSSHHELVELLDDDMTGPGGDWRGDWFR